MEVKKIDLKIGKTSKIMLKKYCITRILEYWLEINTTVDKARNALLNFES